MKDEEKYLCKECNMQVIFAGEKDGEYIYNCKKCKMFYTKNELKYKNKK